MVGNIIKVSEHDCILPIIDSSYEAERVRCRSEYEVTYEGNGRWHYALVYGRTDIIRRYGAEETGRTQHPGVVIPFRGKAAEQGLTAVA